MEDPDCTSDFILQAMGRCSSSFQQNDKDEFGRGGQDASEGERALGRSYSGLSVDDKGAGGSVRIQSEKQTHDEYRGTQIYCRNRPELL